MRGCLLLSLAFVALVCSARASTCNKCEALASTLSASACEEQCRDGWPTYDCRFICQQLLRKSNLSPTAACQRVGLCDKEAPHAPQAPPAPAVFMTSEPTHEDPDWKLQMQRIIADSAAQPRGINREEITWLANERAALEAAQRKLQEERAHLQELRVSLDTRSRDLDARAHAIDKQRSELTAVLRDIVSLKDNVLHRPPAPAPHAEPIHDLFEDPHPHPPAPPPHHPSPPPTQHPQHHTQHVHQPAPPAHQAPAHKPHAAPIPVASPSAYAEWTLFWGCAALGLLCAIAIEALLIPKLETDLNSSFDDEGKMKNIMLMISVCDVVMPSALMIAAFFGYSRPEGFSEHFFLYTYLGLAMGKTALDLYFRVKGFVDSPLKRRSADCWLFTLMAITVMLMIYHGRAHPWLLAHFLLVRHIGDWVNGMYSILGLGERLNISYSHVTAARTCIQALMIVVGWFEISPSPLPWLLTSYMLLSVGFAGLDLLVMLQGMITKIK